jgi:hypothetical protein
MQADPRESEVFALDLSDIQPLFVRPELLAHPNIPKQATGLNPRSVKGRSWWDMARKAAYSRNNTCCWACGTYAGDSLFQQRLEAHESYQVYYNIGVIQLVEVAALCFSCHNFIHSGRMHMLLDGEEMEHGVVSHILITRLAMLEKAGLEPFYGTLALHYHLHLGMPYHSALMQVMKEGKAEISKTKPVKRSLWMLIVEKEVYNVHGRRVI